jgi:hypothetical protein
MLHTKDAFISYSRRNLDFARRVYTALSNKELDIWFDQNDIPLAVDFQHQIDEGIQKADNFIFIISPASIQSAYCAKEVNLAVACGKRIIPILYEMPTNEEMRYMDKNIEKLNWIYMREGQDNFAEQIAGLLSVMESFKDYTKTHTKLLNKAIEWQENRKNHKFLLVNTDRKEAEQWLLQDFSDQAPCVPSEIMCEYISESRENAENLMTDVYITSDKEDKQWVFLINKALQRYGATTWTYETDFKIGTNYEIAYKEGITQSDNFIIVISAKISEYDECIKELEYALSLNKRVIPVLVDSVDTQYLPQILQGLQFIDISHKAEDKEGIADALFSLLDDDMLYYQQHKIILTQAIKWENQQQNPSILLRGYRLESAETWYRINKNRKNQPPTALHGRFIEESLIKQGNLSTEVFISYSRTDSDFTRHLNNELQMYGKTTWFDQENISSGADFQQEIYNGIASSDNFVFIISPDAINSPHCADEVEYAKSLNKRFITIYYRNTDLSTIPKSLRAIQWIDAVGADFHQVFSELIRALDTDRMHVQQHTQWANKAIEWQQKENDASFLLRGNELNIAMAWLKENEETKKKPFPTELQKQFIEESKKLQTKEEKAKTRRQRNFRLVAVMIVSAVVGASAYFINDQIDINNLKKEREQIQAILMEISMEKESLALKEDSLNMLLDKERTMSMQENINKLEKINNISKVKGTIEQQLTYQTRRADSLQRKINAHFLPMQNHIAQLHDIKKELDETNHRFSQFLKFSSRLKPAEQNLLQGFTDRYHEIEKKLEAITK